jgi:uncharacterized protein
MSKPPAGGSLEFLVAAFLGKTRIAIWGMEANADDTSHFVAGRFRKQGVEVIGVHPDFAHEPEQQRTCSLTRIDPAVEAALVYVDREQTMEAVEDCVAAKTPLVWLHDAMSPGAATDEAVARLRAAGCAVIPGLCPMFYLKPVDPAHLCLKWALRWSGKEQRVRRRVSGPGVAP